MTYEDGQIVWGIVMRGLAICNIVHFLSFYSQIVGLIGSKGLHPVKAFLDRVDHNAKHQEWGFFKKYYEYPTIYWISHNSFFLQHSCLLGAILSFLLFIYPTSPFPFFICAILSLSLVTVLGPFNLLMEPMMVEVNILCSFGSVLVLNGFSYFAILLYRFYVFRVMLSAGLVKWYGSKKWKELTAMDTHYLTQPLPNPISYYVHHLPQWVHKFSTLISLVVEIPVTCLLIIPLWHYRIFGLINFIGLMLMINVTGNYGHLGLLTSVISLSLLDDWMVEPLFSIPSSMTVLQSWSDPFILYFTVNFLLIYLAASIIPLYECSNETLRIPILRDIYLFLAKFCVINPYGMFAAMHDKRWELVIEGSDDDIIWKRYLFHYKPSAPDQPPNFVWPPGLWPRVDWHLWFIPLNIQKGKTLPPPWFINLLTAVLEGNEEVLQFFKYNPFESAPPKYIRVSVYDYTFSKPGSRNLWEEKKVGTYGGETKYDLENIWSFSIDAGKNIPSISSSTSYKLSM